MKGTKLVLKSYLESLLIIVICFTFAFILMSLDIIILSQAFSQWCTLIGAGLALWGTLGYLINWKIQTWSGETFSEKVNEYLFKSSYILGTFLIFLGVLKNVV